ncbi:MAG: HYR domain-containing protein [Saprospiraceae bacterium]
MGTSNVCYFITETQDPEGNGLLSDSCCFTVVVEDNQAPAITCQADLTINNDLGDCSNEFTLVHPIATDNCGVEFRYFSVLNPTGILTPNADVTNILTSDYIFHVGLSIVTYTAVDSSGNSVTCSFRLTVVDDEVPVITCPASITVAANTNCEYVVAGSALDASATDNCGVMSLTHNFLGAPRDYTLDNASFPLGITSITWSAVDSAGNVVQCSITVTVIDSTAPTFINCPQDTLTLSNFVDGCVGSVVWSVPLATDNCGATVIHTQGPNPGEVISVGFYTIEYVAIDAAGNTDTCRFVLRIVDTQKPMILCPQNITVDTDDDNCTWESPASSLLPITAMENCPVAITWIVTAPNGATYNGTNDVSGFVFEKGLSQVCYYIIETEDPDSSGILSDSCCFYVLVQDNELPSILCQLDTTIGTDPGVCQAAFLLQHPSPTDNCGIAGLQLIIENPDGTHFGPIFVMPGGSLNYIFLLGESEVTYIATDSSGNTSSCTFNVTVVDDEAPIITCPASLTVAVNNECEFRVENLNLNPIFSDNCGATIAHNYIYGPNTNTLQGSIFETGIYTITWTATDEAGNSATCNFTLTVVDSTAPTFLNCPPDTLTISNFVDNCLGSAIWSAPIASDNCGTTVYQTQGPQPGQVLAVGFYTIQYVARDSFNNTDTCQFVIRILDTQIPMISCPQNITVTTDNAVCNWTSPAASLKLNKASENCPLAVTWTVTNPDGTANSGSSDVSGYVFGKGLSTVCYFIVETEDPEQNGFLHDTCCFTVVVVDDERPLINCPQSVTIGTDDGVCEASYMWNHPTPTDNCEVESLVIVIRNPNGSIVDTTVVVPGASVTRVFDKGVTLLTYVASDSTGNTRTCTFTVTVLDDESPQIYCDSVIACNTFTYSGQPLDITPQVMTMDLLVGVDQIITSIGMPTLNYTNPPSGVLSFTLTSPQGTVLNIGNSAPQGPFAAFVGENSLGNWKLTITSTAPEGCGELISWSLNICGNSVDQQGNNHIVVVANPNSCSYVLNNKSFDVPFSDNCPGSTIQHNWLFGPFNNTIQGSVFPVGIHTITWTATDASGNTSTCNLVIEVKDLVPPMFLNCPKPDVIDKTQPGMCGSFMNFSLPIAADQCGNVTVTQVDATGLNSGDMFPIGTTTLIFRATDASGNTAECSFRVVVLDFDPPTITCPASVTVNNDPGVCGAEVSGLAPVVSDNCPDALNIVYQVEFPAGSGIIVESGTGDASGLFYEVGISNVTYKVQDQPLLLISEVTQNVGAINGGTNPLPAFIQVINGDDYLEVTNLGAASLDISGLEIVRYGSIASSIERYLIPQGTILPSGRVLTIHYGNGTDDPINFFFNAKCALDKAINAPQAYVLQYKNIVLDVVGINGFNPVTGIFPVVTAADWTGATPVLTNQGGFYRQYEFDHNNAMDWLVNDVFTPGSIGALNNTLTALPSNGATFGLQYKKPNVAMCSFQITVNDVEAPECGMLSQMNFVGGGGPIQDGMLLKSMINVPANFEVGDVNLININGTHANTGQLVFRLVSPAGTVLILGQNLCPGGSGFNFGLDSDSLQLITSAPCSPLGGGKSWAPLNNLNIFNGENSQGIWTLEIADMTAGATGQLNGWTLQLSQILAYAQSDTTLENQAGLCGAPFTWKHPNLIDNCPGGTMVVAYTSATNIPLPTGGQVQPGGMATEFFAVGTTTVTYTLIDAHGNTSQCSFNVTVLDVEDPILVCPADITINLQPGQCDAVVNFLPLIVTDNCAIDTIISTPANGSLFHRGTTVVTILVTDIYGNSQSCTFNVTINEFDPTGSALACNDNIQISLGPDCTATVGADDILEGNTYGCYDDYIVLIGTGEYPNNFIPIPNSPVLGLDDVGNIYTVVVIDTVSGNSCWGHISIEDKLNPVIQCPADTLVVCNAATDTTALGSPILLNCELSITTNYTDQVIDNGVCNDPRAQIIRTWVVTDATGNSATCVQTVTYMPFDLAMVVWPLDRDGVSSPAIECSQAIPTELDPAVSGAPTILGTSIMAWDFCDATVGYKDEVLFDCGGSYEVIRHWAVRNKCLPLIDGVNPIRHDQLIIVVDTHGPVFTACMPDITVGTVPYDCYALWDASANKPIAADLCGNILKYEIVGASSNNQYGLGIHTIKFRAKDECGNWSECITHIHVIDNQLPVPVCDKPTTVALLQTGMAKVYATTFDDGSYDGCQLDSFAVRRMSPVPSCGIDTKFRNYVSFCCEDVATSPVMVVLRVYDKAGNYNECMVEVYVQDKVPPIIICPPSITIDCDYPFDLWDLSVFGTVAKLESDRKDIKLKLKDANGYYTLTQIIGKDGITYDNCTADITVLETIDIDNCGTGEIRRTFRATDKSGLSSSCTQIISIINLDPFYVNPDHITSGVKYVTVNGVTDTVAYEISKSTGLPITASQADDIEWPADFEAFTCGESLVPANLPDGYDVPKILGNGCSLVGVGYSDWLFNIQGDACLKIIRRWKVIDWCQFNQSTGEYLVWEYEQIIKVKNIVPPVFDTCADITICTFGPDCSPFVELIQTATDDCTNQDDLKWTYKIDLNNDGQYDITGTGNNASGTYAVGTHRVLWTVEDGCGNKQTCNKLFTVKDCKVPSAVCYNGLAADLMPIDTDGDGDPDAGMVTIWAVDFNASSFDNCTPQSKLKFSFSADTLDKGKSFDCSDLGTNIVQMWVTDEAGNQDWCETYIIIQDNLLACITTKAQVSGYVKTEGGVGVEDAGISIIHNAIPYNTDMTDVLGNWKIQAPVGVSYQLAGMRNDKPLNGVTTLDIVLIQKHILGKAPLSSIYQLVAADVNHSNNVSAADLVELRKLILGKITSFTNNTSWRMVVPTSATKLVDVVGQRSVNNLDTAVTNQEFIGVKIGDINHSAKPNSSFKALESRSGNTLRLDLDDQRLRKGQEYQIPIKALDFNEVDGFQFTLNFDPSVVEIIGVDGKALDISEENIGRSFLADGMMTASWNGKEATSFKDGEQLFSLNIRMKESSNLSDLIRVSSDFTRAEAYRTGGEIQELNLHFEGQSIVDAQYELFQNVPNPWSKETVIGFRLPKTMSATFTVYDVSGKVVYTTEQTFYKGGNEIRLSQSELSGKGVFYYKLETKDWTATKRMVLLGN